MQTDFFFIFKSLEIIYFHVVVKTLASADGKHRVQWPGNMKATALLVDMVVPSERKFLISFFLFFKFFSCVVLSFCVLSG